MAGGPGSSALARGGLRYLMAKLNTAADICLNELSAAGSSKAAGSSSVVSLFSDALKKQLTTVIAVTGAAMAPAINPVRWQQQQQQQLSSGGASAGTRRWPAAAARSNLARPPAVGQCSACSHSMPRRPAGRGGRAVVV